MKHIRDKQHKHGNDYPNWVMFVGLLAIALLSLLSAHLTGII